MRSRPSPPARHSSPSSRGPSVRTGPARAASAAPAPSEELAAINWHHDIGALIRLLDDPGFWTRLIRVLGDQVPVSNWVCIRYDLQAPPVALARSEGPPESEQRFDDYLRRAYLIDPFYLVVRDVPDMAQQGFVTLGEVAPDKFASTAYFQEYFQLNVLADEVQFLVPEEPGRWLSLSLGSARRFSSSELGLLRLIAPWVRALIARRGASGRVEDQVDSGRAPLRGQTPELTAREREVMHLMLSGHSAKLIARRLGISDETVKVHRRHIYAKFKVSTQSQLFSIFLSRET